jgi:hypothetical protein
VSSLKLFIIYKEKRYAMKIRSNVKAGAIATNHNEKLADDNSDNSNSIEQKKSISKKLRLSKETIKILKDGDLKQVAGGAGGNPSDDPWAC